MRVLFLQHDPGATPGLLGEALAARDADIHLLPMARSIADPTWHGDFPAIDDQDLVVSLGAIWSVYDMERLHSWVEREIQWLRNLDKAGTPVLGVCFGGQALAAAHGGKVERMRSMDIGWSTIDSTDLKRLPVGPWMQWHGDHFTPPPGATVLATADVGAQAFTLRNNLAVQFHPEATSDIIGTWLAMGGEAAVEQLVATGTTPDDLLAITAEQRNRARRDIDIVLDWWLSAVGLA